LSDDAKKTRHGYIPISDKKIEEALKTSKEQAKVGKSPEEIIREILDSQQDPKILAEAILKVNVGLLQKMVRLVQLKCPHCGRLNCLTWGCCNKKVIGE